MISFPHPGCLLLSFLAVASLGPVAAQSPTTSLASVKLDVLPGDDTTPFTAAARAGGAQIGDSAGAIPQDAEVVLCSSTALRHMREPGKSEANSAFEACLKQGGSVIFYVPDNGESFKAIEDLLPVNVWSIETNQVRRGDTGAVAPQGSPLAAAMNTAGFHLENRYELHLPYSTREAGQQRYDWTHLGKPLLNTDWTVLLNSDTAGDLPLLVEGRCFAGKVFIFGGDLGSAELTGWSGYAGFVQALLACAAPGPAAASSDAGSLKLSIPLDQSGEPLHVEIENPTAQSIPAVLACKVRNLTESLMNSCSQAVTVPANQTVSVTIPETAAILETAIAPRSSDEATPIRRIEAGLCSPDRQEIAVRASGMVDQTPAVTLKIEGEDVRKFPDKDHWSAGGSGFLSGGMPLDRYTYFCGETPQVTIHLRNALHNVAPLATATDEGWAENPMTGGLNDGCYSYNSVRGRYNGLSGYWAGQSAATQTLQLSWPDSVTITRERLVAQTAERNWEKLNPLNYTLNAGNDLKAAPLTAVQNASYEFGRREDLFKPAALTSCTLNITGLDPAFAFGDVREFKANCALDEWEVYGWPSATLPPAIKGKLIVKIRDLSRGVETTALEKEVSLDPLTESSFPVSVPTLKGFGQVSVEAEFQPDSGVATHFDFPVLFIPDGRTHLISRNELGEVQAGYLCSPGFVAIDPFGTGARDDTKGWGGPDDQVWAWEHDLMEIGSRSKENVQRFLLSPVGMTHYTNPWRNFPSGRYVWDWATDHLVDRFTNGSWKGQHSIHIVLSDRWNGLNIGTEFAWADFISFDEYLKGEGKPGLKGKTRTDLSTEILTQYGDEYQKFQLNRYADKLLDSQKRLAGTGVQFTVETHGDFPLAGGDLGEKLAQTDVAVGTDLFWDKRNEDMYRTLGWRYGIVAANPDLKSGAYGQWGWINSELANPTWFSPSGEVEPSRLQWYATYWEGRVTSAGEFQPYTVYGFSYQGEFGAKNTLDDWNNLNRVQSTMIWLRPELAAGFGLVASWQLQEHRMGPLAGRLGFGLYASAGNDQVDVLTGELYQHLVKNGVPLSFVASTATLKKWNGTQPLIVGDGYDTDAWEIAELDRLNRAGTPIIAVGSSSRPDRGPAEDLFGARKTDSGWSVAPDTEVVKDATGQPFAFICRRAGRAATLFCPTLIDSLQSDSSKLLARLCLELCDKPLTVSSGIATSVFRSNGSLFLVLGSQGDEAQEISVTLRPAFFDPTLTGKNLRVVDLDRAQDVDEQWDHDSLHFQVPCGPNDGRMIQILQASPSSP
jgi:hypothetical protein